VIDLPALEAEAAHTLDAAALAVYSDALLEFAARSLLWISGWPATVIRTGRNVATSSCISGSARLRKGFELLVAINELA
jgi:hypothetical protein